MTKLFFFLSQVPMSTVMSVIKYANITAPFNSIQTLNFNPANDN